MKLVGMLDSPYVRRVAVSLQLLGLPFEHQSLSVFRTFDEFRRINPVVKAPTLVCDDGEVLMDSTLILEYAHALAHPRTLRPSQPRELQHKLRLNGARYARVPADQVRALHAAGMHIGSHAMRHMFMTSLDAAAEQNDDGERGHDQARQPGHADEMEQMSEGGLAQAPESAAREEKRYQATDRGEHRN